MINLEECNRYKKELLKKYKTSIIRNSFIVLASVILEILAPIIFKGIFAKHENAIEFNNSIIWFLIIFTLSYVVRILSIWISSKFSLKFRIEETEELYKKMFKVKYKKLNSFTPVYLVDRLSNSINVISDLIVQNIPKLIVSIIAICTIFILIFKVNKGLFILNLLLMIAYYFGKKRLTYKLGVKSQHMQKLCSENFKNVLAVTSNVDYIKQSGDNTWLISLIKGYVKNIENEIYSVNKYAQYISSGIEYLINLIQSLTYIYLVYLYMDHKILMSDLIYINLINSIFFAKLQELAKINVDLRDLKGALNFIENELIANEEENGSILIDEIKNISAKNIKLGYGKELIKEGNFSNNKGDIVYIKGKSGVGKSTLTKTFNKMLESNFIKINGIDLKELNNDSLRNRISILSQNIFMLPISIKDNILLGREVSEDKFNHIINKPFMKKFLELDDKLDTIINENGSNLSGGDKQKIALARILIDDPDVIILDESTNSIDESTAKEILDDIMETFSDKLIYIISHDNYAYKYCNNTIEINEKNLSQYNLVNKEL